MTARPYHNDRAAHDDAHASAAHDASCDNDASGDNDDNDDVASAQSLASSSGASAEAALPPQSQKPPPVRRSFRGPRHAWSLGRVGPIPLYASWSSLLLILIAGYLQNFDAVQTALLVAVLVPSLLLHELGHGFAALGVGHVPKYIVLHALGGVCYTRRDEGTHPWRIVAVMAAGPLVNLVLSVGCLGLIAILGSWQASWLLPGLESLSLQQFFSESFVIRQIHHAAGRGDDLGGVPLLWSFG